MAGTASRRSALRVALALVALTIVGAATGAWIVAGALSRPARVHLSAPPEDLGAEEVRIPLARGGTLAGWLARGGVEQGAILLLHEVRGSRASMVDRARVMHRAGYTVLLVDLPAHGESPGERITFGARESDGARAALAYLRRVAPTERVGAFGTSLGGASLLLGAEEPAANLADVVVLESVYPTIEEAVADRLRIRLGAVGPALAPLLTLQLGPRLGVSAAELRPIERIDAVRVPVLVIAGERDRHTTLAESRRLFAAARSPKDFWIVPDAAHGELHRVGGPAYERRLLDFFGAHLRLSNR